MELKDYIEKAELKAGKQTELAKILGISAGHIRMVKGGTRGLPEAICMKLADYLNEDRLLVVAASGLVTEKDEGRRKILESCFRRVAGLAAVAIVTFIVTLPLAEPVNAGVLNHQLAKMQIKRNWFMISME